MDEDTVTVTGTEEGTSEVEEQTITRKLSELEMDEGRVVIAQGIAAGEADPTIGMLFFIGGLDLLVHLGTQADESLQR